MGKKVVLGMSGGVDSSVSAILLQKQGYEVIGVTMKLWEEVEDGKELPSSAFDAKKVCDTLGIEHKILDCRKMFHEKVMENFVEEYKSGRTPNPCIVCNRFLKFGAMLEFAKQCDAEYIATGHYAKVEYNEKYQQKVICKANAKKKDQTYVLYSIPKEVIPYMVFPLSDFESKEQIRKIAEESNLQVAHKSDSQDICFIPDNNYVGFLAKQGMLKDMSGNIVDTNGKVRGKHNGYFHYTIGQRRGLGIANATPLYVVGINSKSNLVIVGEEKDLYKSEVEIEKVNWLIPKVSEEIEVKIRYAALPVKATYIESNDKIVVKFSEPQRAPTPGQSIVFYDGNVLLGGGIIK